jgi:hypothetical protein
LPVSGAPWGGPAPRIERERESGDGGSGVVLFAVLFLLFLA